LKETTLSTLGVALLALGAALAVAEAHVVSYGVLGISALVAIAAGITLVVDAAGAGLAVGLGVGLAAASVGAVYGAFVLARVLAVRRAPVRGGRAGLLGHRGEARNGGRVMVDGALWRARVWDPEEEPELRAGEPVVVEHVDGLTLTVRRAEEWEVAP
jgi:membrane-bound serine protease (ClpP class)